MSDVWWRRLRIVAEGAFAFVVILLVIIAASLGLGEPPR